MNIALILGDQLSQSIQSLQQLNKQSDLVLMAEVGAEATYVAHHKQKIALIFSAMRHFADELAKQGWQVDYHYYDETRPQLTLCDVLSECVRQHKADQVFITECGEFRLQDEISTTWSQRLGIPVTLSMDSRFLSSKAEFAQWVSNRKQLRMEYFYRDMRRKTGLLMQDGEPVGGQWNFDSDNREPYRGDPAIPSRHTFQRDKIDQDVLALVDRCFGNHPGQLTQFNWPTTREQALFALDVFVNHQLRWFGDYQDAMKTSQHFMFHSLLSTSLNCGLLTAMEVCIAAETAWREGNAPLNAVEGFIRQIIGWREYVRGIYWLKMPAYAKQNFLRNTRKLPQYYWSGNTDMACMSACFQNTFEHAYAHHIQRLMITGNFALLAGVDPEQICEWYLAVYADAYDWVELPNTLGMVMHADAGLLASKPYAASGSYIHRMSDYCKNCRYQVKTSSEHDSCPFNSLYWHFISRHADQFQKNPRMSMIYRSYQRMDDTKKLALQNRAEYLLEHIDEL
ncbi:MAG: cryptochrome/photolyase family protein [Pseudohongiella sp.]|nr:cryptochrome/photolyase family protein [Pseudohongiella sp.]